MPADSGLAESGAPNSSDCDGGCERSSECCETRMSRKLGLPLLAADTTSARLLLVALPAPAGSPPKPAIARLALARWRRARDITDDEAASPLLAAAADDANEGDDDDDDEEAAAMAEDDADTPDAPPSDAVRRAT